MRIITAPGVEIKEIDKSQYSPSMTGTACYVMGFANQGEAYIPMEFTSARLGYHTMANLAQKLKNIFIMRVQKF